MKKIFAFIVFTCLSISVFAQQKITVKAPVKDPNQYIHLAHYYGYKQFIKVDSAKVNDHGILEFKNTDNAWKGGVYLIVYSPSKFYDFVYSGTEKDIRIEFDTTDFTSTVKFINSPENEQLFNYRKYMVEKSKEAASLQEVVRNGQNPVEVEKARITLNGLQKEANKELKKRVAAKPNLFASKLMLANLEPELPDTPPLLPNGKPDTTFFYRYYKEHFFDHLDFSEERLIRTPFIDRKIDQYLTNLVYSRTDSLKKEIAFITKKAKANPEMYRYVLWNITNRYETTDIVGLDGVVVDLYENYYLKDATWLDADQKQKFADRLSVLKPIQTGAVMPELILNDGTGKKHNLNDVKAKYTIVYFYSPTCSHCKEHAPKLAAFQEENRQNGVVVWNVSTDADETEINKFIQEFGMNKLINLYDAEKKYDFYHRYDVYSTPTLYILDSEKRILAKRIPIEEVMGFIAFHERNK